MDWSEVALCGQTDRVKITSQIKPTQGSPEEQEFANGKERKQALAAEATACMPAFFLCAPSPLQPHRPWPLPLHLFILLSVGQPLPLILWTCRSHQGCLEPAYFTPPFPHLAPHSQAWNSKSGA